MRAAFALIALISMLTAGPDECRAWPLRRGTCAPTAAAVIRIAEGTNSIPTDRMEMVTYTYIRKVDSHRLILPDRVGGPSLGIAINVPPVSTTGSKLNSIGSTWPSASRVRRVTSWVSEDSISMSGTTRSTT